MASTSSATSCSNSEAIRQVQALGGTVERVNLDSIPLKKGESPCPEITEALAKGDFSTFAPWLKEQGWTQEWLKNLQSDAEILREKKGGEFSIRFVQTTVLNHSIEKASSRVFKTVPKGVFNDAGYSLRTLELLAKKKKENPTVARYREMEATLIGILPSGVTQQLRESKVES